MPTYEKSVDVAVPVREAYDQWTRFESFPEFMEGVDQVERHGDIGSHWVTSFGGARREFDAEITERRPDERIAWHTVGEGPSQAGLVTFHRLDPHTTRVRLQLDFQPEGLTERAGAASGAVGRRLQGDLERFKEMIEARDDGAWRDDATPKPQPRPKPGPPPSGGPRPMPGPPPGAGARPKPGPPPSGRGGMPPR